MHTWSLDWKRVIIITIVMLGILSESAPPLFHVLSQQFDNASHFATVTCYMANKRITQFALEL
jgi:hypothetical protein